MTLATRARREYAELIRPVFPATPAAAPYPVPRERVSTRTQARAGPRGDTGPMAHGTRGRPAPGTDIGIGLLLLAGEIAAYVWRMFTYGMETWADPSRSGAVALAGITWTRNVLIAAVTLTALALWRRARWCAALQLLAAATLTAFLLLAHHDQARTHPGPAG